MSDPVSRLRENIAQVFLGHDAAIDRVICCLIARGHLLIEDVPGVGKTVLATALARSIDGHFCRVQLTPDLLPADVLGVSVFQRESGEFVFKRGPIFTNVLLADELNRTTPRTQSALLEAMNDGTVSIDGVTHRLEQPFIVIATQNPGDFEGTYALPENQLDRFLMRVRLGYPSPADEARVLSVRPAAFALPHLEPVLSLADVTELQARADAVRVDESILRYIVELATATRRHPDLRLGLSPRGSLALAQAARARAVMQGRDYVLPDDVLDNVLPVCSHRDLARAPGSDADGEATARVLAAVVRSLVPPG